MIKTLSDSDAGVNVRWAITPDMVGNLTINPDFSQVEADIAQLDINNTFALFFQETRPFFLEGQDFFSSPLNAVFTRTIADPDIGAKLTATLDDNSIGVLIAEDSRTNLLFPGALGSRNTTLQQSNEVVVGRYRRSFGERSTIGTLLTSRTGKEYSNLVAGVDGLLRPSDRHTFRYQYLNSTTDYPEAIVTDFAQPAGGFSGDALQLNYEFDSRSYFAFFNHRNVDSGFRADSGFISQVDRERYGGGFGRAWYSEGGRWWNSFQLGTNYGQTDRGDGTLINSNRNVFVNINARRQSFMRLNVSKRKQFWNGQTYDIDGFFVLGNVRPIGALSFTVAAESADQIDFTNSRLGKQRYVEGSINWNVNRHLRMNLVHTSSDLDTQGGDKIFSADLLDLRATWQFNTRSYLRLTVQDQRISRNAAQFTNPDIEAASHSRGTQLLYSYQLNPQTVAFFGYSDNQLENNNYLSLTKTDRTLFLKLSYAWIPR